MTPGVVKEIVVGVIEALASIFRSKPKPRPRIDIHRINPRTRTIIHEDGTVTPPDLGDQ